MHEKICEHELTKVALFKTRSKIFELKARNKTLLMVSPTSVLGKYSKVLLKWGFHARFS